MTSEISEAGYTDLDIGGAIAARWSYIEFQTSASAKIIRISTSDARVTQTALDSDHVTYSVALTGADADIAALKPVTFSKAVFKKLDTDGAAVMGTDTFTDGTLWVADDSLTITLNAGIIG